MRPSATCPISVCVVLLAVFAACASCAEPLVIDVTIHSQAIQDEEGSTLEKDILIHSTYAFRSEPVVKSEEIEAVKISDFVPAGAEGLKNMPLVLELTLSDGALKKMIGLHRENEGMRVLYRINGENWSAPMLRFKPEREIIVTGPAIDGIGD